MWFCDVVITPLARAWPAELALCRDQACTLVLASEIDVASVLKDAEGLAYLSLCCVNLRLLGLSANVGALGSIDR